MLPCGRAHLHPTPRAHPSLHLALPTPCQRLPILPAPFFDLSLFKFSSFVLSIVILNYFDYAHFCFKGQNILTGNTLDVPVFSSIVSLNRIPYRLSKTRALRRKTTTKPFSVSYSVDKRRYKNAIVRSYLCIDAGFEPSLQDDKLISISVDN